MLAPTDGRPGASARPSGSRRPAPAASRGVPDDQAGQQAALVGRQPGAAPGGARPGAHRRRAAPAAGGPAAPADHNRHHRRDRLAGLGWPQPAGQGQPLPWRQVPQRRSSASTSTGARVRTADREPRPGRRRTGTMSRSPSRRSPRLGHVQGAAPDRRVRPQAVPWRRRQPPQPPLPARTGLGWAPTVDPTTRHSRTRTTARAIPLRPARPARTAATVSDRPMPSTASQPTE